MIANAIAAAGSAVTVGPPALLNRDIRNRVKVIQYDDPKAYSLCLIRSVHRTRARSAEHQNAIDCLERLLVRRLDLLVAQQDLQTVAKVGFYVTKDQRETCSWREAVWEANFVEANRFTGSFRLRVGTKTKKPERYIYRLSGQLEQIPGGKSSVMSWTGNMAALRGSTTEQFHASHVVYGSLTESNVLVGTWTGRRTQPTKAQDITPYIGYMILMSDDEATNQTTETLNSLAIEFSERYSFPQFELPDSAIPIARMPAKSK